MGDVVSQSRCITVSANFTRPNDTNAYQAGDVVADSTTAAAVITIPLQGPGGTVGKLGSGLLMTATLLSSANVATKLDGRLWIFDTAPASYGNDNEALTLTDAEMRTVLQVILFPTGSWVAGDATVGAGGNAMCNAQSLWLPINTTKDANAIYCVLEARNAYVPVAQERFDLRLGVVL